MSLSQRDNHANDAKWKLSSQSEDKGAAVKEKISSDSRYCLDRRDSHRLRIADYLQVREFNSDIAIQTPD